MKFFNAHKKLPGQFLTFSPLGVTNVYRKRKKRLQYLSERL